MALGIYEEEDIRAIAEEMRVWGQTDKTYTVRQMVQGVNDVASAAHSDGYVGGHTAGVEEGKAIGYEEGQRDGYESGRADGITEGFYEGEAIGYQNGITEGVEQGKTEAYAEVEPINTQLENTLNGTDTGGKSFYDEFWDNFQDYGRRASYNSAFLLTSYAGGSWTDAIYNPKYEIDCTGNPNGANGVFVWNNQISDIKVPMDCRGVAMSNTFLGGYNGLVTIPLLRVNEQTTYSSTFDYDNGLVNLTIDGVIGQNGFNVQWSTKLSKASIISIINALSTTTSGLSVTLSKTAVETAFGSTESEEWIALINTRSNWTINLV